MSDRIEVEELRLAEPNHYLAVVRMNRYKKEPQKLSGVEFEVERKAETLAEFTVRVPRRPHGRQKKERSIEDIKSDAREAVFSLCQEVVRMLQPAQKTPK